jgi:FkbM family methyltransferase
MTKTVFGDILKDFYKLGNELVGIDDFHINNQLLRCKNHKMKEMEIMMSFPKNASFLDVGAHFGDTILTMALYALNNNRPDIRFFAFEPNKKKCEFIKNIAKKNNLNIKIYNVCVGSSSGFAIEDIVSGPWYGGGRSYKYADNSSIQILKLDDIENEIFPIGLLHIDVEGWEIETLKGCHNILNNKKNKFILICECWSDNTAKFKKETGRTGNIVSLTPRQSMEELLSKYNSQQLKDICDSERNLVFKIN